MRISAVGINALNGTNPLNPRSQRLKFRPGDLPYNIPDSEPHMLDEYLGKEMKESTVNKNVPQGSQIMLQLNLMHANWLLRA